MNLVKITLALCALASLFAACRERSDRVSTEARSGVAAHGSLKVQGGRIVDKNGQPFQLKGMSFFWSQWGGAFWNSSALKELKHDWKANVIRAPMGIEVGGFLTNPQLEKDRIKLIVEEAIAQNIYVIIDWHDHGAHLRTDKALAFFSEMASLYGKNPHVIFEIYNEPIDVSWDVVRTYAQTVIAAIRASGSENLVIVGTPDWSQRVDLAAEKPLADKNVAYALHFYAGSHGQELRDIASKAIAKGLPLFVTEFGVCDVSGELAPDLAETEVWLDFLDKHGISWVNWAFHDKSDNASALKSGSNTAGPWSDGDLTPSGSYVRGKLRE